MPIALLEAEDGALPRLRCAVPKDAPVTYDDVALPDSELLRLFRRQSELLNGG